MAPVSLRNRFGRPQIFAGLLLLVFLAQCLWLASAHHERELDSNLIEAVHDGIMQWHGGPTPDNATHSPLWFLLLSFPVSLFGLGEASPLFAVAVAIPQIVFGALLGASLWYVARRLYGNAGGYVALALYCFSPGIIRSSTLWFAEPEMPAAWGAFGAVFTAIAVAHTLYAPREVVLWNWRRILLLGLSFTLAIGCQFSLAVLVPLALLFMLYLAWERRSAVVAIWMTAAAVAVLLLATVYLFRPHQLLAAYRNAIFFPLQWRAFISVFSYRMALARVSEISPALLLALPAALLCYFLWPRTRYFGNSAPLLIGTLLVAFAIGTPHLAGFGFYVVSTPFLFVFVAGISADLLETQHRTLVLVCISALLMANAAWCLKGLASVPSPFVFN